MTFSYHQRHMLTRTVSSDLTVLVPEAAPEAPYVFHAPPATALQDPPRKVTGWQSETTSTFLTFMAIGFAATIATATMLTITVLCIRKWYMTRRRRLSELQKLQSRSPSIQPEDVVVVENPGELVMAIKMSSKTSQQDSIPDKNLIKVEMQPNNVMMLCATAATPVGDDVSQASTPR